MRTPCKQFALEFKAFVDTAIADDALLAHLDSCMECQAALEDVAKKDTEALEAVACVIEEDAPVIRDPVEGNVEEPMPCRRGKGHRIQIQGQEPPPCDGEVLVDPDEPRPLPVRGTCQKCGLTHVYALQNGKTVYGAAL